MRVLFEEGGKQSEKDTAPTAVRLALRDWIGSRLLQTNGTRGEFRHLEATMQGELRKAGLSIPFCPSLSVAFSHARNVRNSIFYGPYRHLQC